VFSVENPELSAATAVLKRCVDIVLSLAMLLVTAPLMFVVWLAVRLASRGPGFYRQERIGWRGKPFLLLKFRTMVAGAERFTGPVLATEDDARITALGRILRATHLDELPQLFNVLRGEMSLVGPRPERPFFTSEYEVTIPNYAVRNLVRPGITGLAQIMAGYDAPAECKICFDIIYVYSCSLLLDLRILLQTLATMLYACRRSAIVKAAGSTSCLPESIEPNVAEANCEDKMAA
jgi:lipopolysaccharide/colanic/teichoic acid biosynthesis glycosyltransferase